jgi:hypothetical protein
VHSISGRWIQSAHRTHGTVTRIAAPLTVFADAFVYFFKAVSYGDSLYVFGGTDRRRRQQDLFKFHIPSSTWSAVEAQGTPPPRRSGGQGAVCRSKLFIFGGYDGRHGNYFNDLFVFDFDSKQWTTLPEQGTVPEPRTDHIMVLHDSAEGDSLYIMGGYDGRVRYNNIYRYDIRTMQWTEEPMRGAPLELPSPWPSPLPSPQSSPLLNATLADGTAISDQVLELQPSQTQHQQESQQGQPVLAAQPPIPPVSTAEEHAAPTQPQQFQQDPALWDPQEHIPSRRFGHSGVVFSRRYVYSYARAAVPKPTPPARSTSNMGEPADADAASTADIADPGAMSIEEAARVQEEFDARKQGQEHEQNDEPECEPLEDGVALDASQAARLHLSGGGSIVEEERSEDGLCVFGGWDGRHTLDDLFWYSFPRQTWSRVRTQGRTPEHRYRHTAVCDSSMKGGDSCSARQSGDYMYLFGGVNRLHQRFNDLQCLHIPTWTWSAVQCYGSIHEDPSRASELSTERSCLAARLVGGMVGLAQGGLDSVASRCICWGGTMVAIGYMISTVFTSASCRHLRCWSSAQGARKLRCCARRSSRSQAGTEGDGN